MTGEKPNESLVVPSEPMHPEGEVGNEQAGEDRHRGDDEERDEDAADVGPERVAHARQRRQAAPAARLRVQDRERQQRSPSVGRWLAGSGIVLGCEGLGRQIEWPVF